MTVITRSALVMHSAEQMFELVNDVKRYPEFLQGCKATQIIDSGDTFMQASMTLAKAGFEQTIVTRNILAKPERIDMQLVEGPFSRFSSVWRFQALSEEACKVSFDMEFEVSNRLASVALSALFKQVANTMVDAFVARGKQIYG
ncbi:MAG: type II toxin-antitoxin system RatA family toxin [Venatoribacter sp.]